MNDYFYKLRCNKKQDVIVTISGVFTTDSEGGIAFQKMKETCFKNLISKFSCEESDIEVCAFNKI